MSASRRDLSFLPAEKLHGCCARDCEEIVLTGYVACRIHWQAVPRDVRRLLTLVFRRREAEPVAFAQAVDLAREFVRSSAA